jgi:membrane protein implicated in regulation of membrane protease activity
MERKQPVVNTNTDALIGKTGRVLETIIPDSSEGRVKIGGEDWWAISESGIRIEKEEMVTIIRIEGVKVFVKRIDQTKGEL